MSEIGLTIKKFLKEKIEVAKKHVLKAYEKRIKPTITMFLLRVELKAYKIVKNYHSIVEKKIQDSIDRAQEYLAESMKISKIKMDALIEKQTEKIEKLKQKLELYEELHPVE